MNMISNVRIPLRCASEFEIKGSEIHVTQARLEPQVAGPALGLNNVPHVVFAPVIGILGKAVKGLLPW